VSQTKLKAEPRTEFGKGAARRIRRAHKIPAVLYGHGEKPQHIALPGHETMLALKHANALLDLEIEGGQSTLALAKDVQRDAVRRTIDHVDLVIVKRGEKVHVEVSVHVTGESAPDTLVNLEMPELMLEAEATNIPDVIAVSVQDAPVGFQVLAGDVTLPEGCSLVSDPEHLVINVMATQTAEQAEADLAEAEAQAGIEHEAPAAAEAEGGDQAGA
jgi:large subunit ribosomal protein L25